MPESVRHEHFGALGGDRLWRLRHNIASPRTVGVGARQCDSVGLSFHWHEETAHGRQELPAETQPTAAKIEAQSQEAESESHDNPVSPVPSRGFFHLVGAGASMPRRSDHAGGRKG
jgi:hypothetical protein